MKELWQARWTVTAMNAAAFLVVGHYVDCRFGGRLFLFGRRMGT